MNVTIISKISDELEQSDSFSSNKVLIISKLMLEGESFRSEAVNDSYSDLRRITQPDLDKQGAEDEMNHSVMKILQQVSNGFLRISDLVRHDIKCLCMRSEW